MEVDKEQEAGQTSKRVSIVETQEEMESVPEQQPSLMKNKLSKSQTITQSAASKTLVAGSSKSLQKIKSTGGSKIANSKTITFGKNNESTLKVVRESAGDIARTSFVVTPGRSQTQATSKLSVGDLRSALKKIVHGITINKIPGYC